jgi:hypothetical protein
MAGVNWPKRGEHWSRGEFKTELSVDVNRQLIIAAYKYTKYTISNDNLWSLIKSVAMANNEYRKTLQRAATRNDTLCSLEAMLTLDNASLLDAISNCDTQTREEISVAQNRIPWEDIDWVSSEYGNMKAPLGPRAIRRSVLDAFNTAKETKIPRGPKSMPYQVELARTCVLIWLECKLPPRTPGRLEFAQAAFGAAGMVLGDKRIGALLSKVGKSEMTKVKLKR